MPDQLIAIYENADGERREAYSATDAVNLKAHGYTRVTDVDPDTMAETPTPAGRRASLDQLTEESQDAGLYDAPDVVPPPLGGAGSGIDAWREYADALKFDTAGLDKREDIVDALREAGHPVEPPAADDDTA